jgi:translocation and assembly module TamB
LFLRWLHKAWTFLLSMIVVLFVTITLGGMILFGLLQLPQSQAFISSKVTELFNEQYQGRITIENLGGTLPYSANLENIRFFPDKDSDDPVLAVREATIRISLWDLLQRVITIRSFELDDPVVHLKKSDDSELLTIQNTFAYQETRTRDRSENLFERIQVYAPSIIIRGGELYATDIHDRGSDSLFPPASFTLNNIDADLFLELSSFQRFLDIGHISANIDGEDFDHFHLSGQIFSDDQYLEFNGFQVRLDDSQVQFSGSATPIDLQAPDLEGQLANATFQLILDNTWIRGNHIARFVADYPFTDDFIDLELDAEGTLEDFYIDRLIARMQENAIYLTGNLRNLITDDFQYEANLSNIVLQPDVFRLISENYFVFGDEEVSYLSESQFNGRVNGNLQNLYSDLHIETNQGSVILEAALAFDDPLAYIAELRLDSLDLSPVFPTKLERNHLNGIITLDGSGTDPDFLNLTITADLDSGYVNHIDFSRGMFRGSISDQNFNHTFLLQNGSSEVRSTGNIARVNDTWSVSAEGMTRNIDVRHILQRMDIPNTSMNLEFNTELAFTGFDDLNGRVSFQVDESAIGMDTLRAHQFYADLDSPAVEGGERNLRLTSSFLDAEIRGDIYPTNLYNLYRHWNGYIQNQIAEEIVMDTTAIQQFEELSFSDQISSANLHINLELKDIELLQKYYLEEPVVETRSRLNLNVNADDNRLLITGSLNDSGFRYGNFESESMSANFTTSLRYAEKFRDYGTMDIQLNADNYRYNNFQFRNGYVNTSMRSDSIMVQHSSRGMEDEVNLNLNVFSRLNPGDVVIEIRDFMFGSDTYAWRTEHTPVITLFQDRSLLLENVNIISDEERIEINGTFSSSEEDRVEYLVRNLNLQRISELIGGRVRFAGTADGDFYTTTLTQIPTFEGNLNVKRFMLEERLVGDVRINSQYSTSEDRFNTSISVLTDPDRYPDYFAENDSIGHNLRFDGYFKTPDLDNPDEEFFSFDADLREIDMWIVTVIVPQIVTEMEGRSSGTGYIRGSLTDYDFSAEFDIQDVMGVPFFVNVPYNISGTLLFDRFDGLIFEDIRLRDPQGGTGILTGTVDLDDFSDYTYLDLTLDLNNLLFMNNPYDPDVPFYANARGTGQARITGSNFDPYLRTTQPIAISQGSRISVPVVDDAELQQSYSFIQFVDSFDWRTFSDENILNGRNGDGTPFQFDPEALTFVERFTLDLQFIAEQPVNFRLIFDRVTNEILSASGTGQIRLSLEDENFSIFGRMNISGGDYQFVAGDIISRRFQLVEGGSIIWEGDPANARLNVNATYRARPDLTALVSSGAREMQGGQRFPVDLVLHIGGTLSELENDFYFQIPSSIEGTLDPTLLTQVNALNRNEEEKIIQATSILLSGNFIPLTIASTEGGTGMALRETLTGGAVVVNPLITSQVINPLLSDQINSLLRSDMSLDIDFNLTTLNEIDLGVALRLYDDRLILRRDGVITGEYSDIGDLGATYRINRIFAVTAFHRQDPTLTSASAAEVRQVQEMNGLGLEAQFQFNTWQELKQRFTRAISRLFGRKEREEDDSEDDGEAIASE